MRDEVSQLMAALVEAKSFEEAALHTLRMMLRASEDALASSRFAPRGRILRGTVQIRPDDSFRRLVVLEAEAARGVVNPEALALDEVDSSTFVASVTAWHAVLAHKCPVSIDVNMGTFQAHSPSASGPLKALVRETFGNESRQRFLGRQASHVHVLPLRTPGGGVDGIVSIEAECLAAVGQEFIWPQVVGQLQTLLGAAASYLVSLPLRPKAAPAGDEFLPVIGTTMASLVPILRVFAQQEETILLSGATGSGKSRLARWCHEQSRRRAQRFETLDLVTVPEELQMAELFGWRKGAFTSAVRDNPGSVARADGGTLFIDEIDKLSLKAQAGLLHVLETRAYRMLGEGAAERHADVRFIVGTNVDLRAAVRAGHFREDLYYRINVLPVRVPALEERRDEIARWAHYMLNRRHREGVPEGHARISPEAERVLGTAHWPGNLRQLDNIIRRAYTLALAERGVAHDVTLEERHVSRALAFEEVSSRRVLLEQLQRAALAFVLEAHGRTPPLDLDLADAFRGFVLATAIQQFGREEAFRMLGKESLVKNRNHHKALRREMEKVDALLRAIGQEQSPFADLLQDSDDDEER